MRLLLRLLGRNFDDLRIGQKLFRVILLLLGTTALVILATFPTVQRWQLETRSHSQAMVIGHLLARGMAAEAAAGRTSALENQLASLAAVEEIHAAAVFRPDGGVLAVYMRPGDDFDPERARRVEAPGLSVARPVAVLDRQDHNIAVVGLFQEGRPVGRLLLEQSTEDTARAILQMRALALAVCVVGMGSGVGLFSLILKRIIRPLAHLDEAARQVAAGDYSAHVAVEAKDEIGQLAEAFNRMLETIRGNVGQLRDQQAYLARNVDTVLDAMRRLAAGQLDIHLQAERDDTIGQLLTGVDATAGQLRELVQGLVRDGRLLAESAESLADISREMLGEAGEGARRAGAMASQTQAVDAHIQSVASATEQMGASIREIARNSSEAASTASGAVSLSEEAGTVVGKLGESSREIGQVVGVINSIAEQTNLLALNATIEAARAGAAGKGFAVVANEVKELAKETALATETIGARVEAIRQDTEQAVQAIARIQEAIARVHGIQTATAGAVEEQAVTTSEIGLSLTSAAAGSRSIAGGVEAMVKATEGTQADAVKLRDAAVHLSRISTSLNEAVRRFRT